MKGILLIHGFSGKRADLKQLYRHFKKRGYKVALPRLAGHEKGEQALADVSYSDWLKSAEKAFLKLDKHCSDITVIGYSMGGLIAVNLYQKYRFSRLVTINTPVFCWDHKKVAMGMHENFRAFIRWYAEALKHKPVKALLEFEKLKHNTLALIRCVKCDTLILQAVDDKIVNVKSADYLLKHMRGNRKMVKLKAGGHGVVITSHCRQVILQIDQFLAHGVAPKRRMGMKTV